jgi:hypothetical protein
VRTFNVASGDTAVVTFSYNPDGRGPPILTFFDPATGNPQPVQGSALVADSYVVDPASHTVRVVFDSSSFPSLSNLTGTLFTLSVAAPVTVPMPPSLPLPSPAPPTLPAPTATVSIPIPISVLVSSGPQGSGPAGPGQVAGGEAGPSARPSATVTGLGAGTLAARLAALGGTADLQTLRLLAAADVRSPLDLLPPPPPGPEVLPGLMPAPLDPRSLDGEGPTEAAADSSVGQAFQPDEAPSQDVLPDLRADAAQDDRVARLGVEHRNGVVLMLMAALGGPPLLPRGREGRRRAFGLRGRPEPRSPVVRRPSSVVRRP